MVNYGIVGAGYFGADLARSMNKIEDAKVVAVFDPNHGEEVAQELGSDVCASLDELVAREDIDCVIVASPSYLHREPVVKAAQHGKHVFCEKPIALSYEDCKAMVDACKENNVIFMAGHIMNFFNGVHHAKELITQGKIGKVLYCHAARTGWEEQQPTVSWKKLRSQSGGHLYHHIHELDCIQFIMGGLPEKATMVGESHFLVHETQEEDDDRTAIYTGRGMDGAIAYGKPGVRCPLWLQTCIDKEMEYLHDIIKGGEITEEFEKLLNGVAALESIATADACTLSVKEDRKVRLSEITNA